MRRLWKGALWAPPRSCRHGMRSSKTTVGMRDIVVLLFCLIRVHWLIDWIECPSRVFVLLLNSVHPHLVWLKTTTGPWRDHSARLPTGYECPDAGPVPPRFHPGRAYCIRAITSGISTEPVSDSCNHLHGLMTTRMGNHCKTISAAPLIFGS